MRTDGALLAVCFTTKFGNVGMVGLFDTDADVHEVISKHSEKFGRNPLTDYVVFRSLVCSKDDAEKITFGNNP